MINHQMVPQPKREVGVCQLLILRAQRHLDSQQALGLEVRAASGEIQVRDKEVLPTPQAGVRVQMLHRGLVAQLQAGQVQVSNRTVGMCDCCIIHSVGYEEMIFFYPIKC